MRTSDNRRNVVSTILRDAVADLEDATRPATAEADAKRRGAMDAILAAAEELAQGAEGASDDLIEWAIKYGTDVRRPTTKRARYGVEWKDSHGQTRWTYGASYDEAIQKARVDGEVRPSIGRRVTVRGNTGLPDVSGRRGVVVSHHPDGVAVRVRLDGDAKSLLLDSGNLE